MYGSDISHKNWHLPGLGGADRLAPDAVQGRLRLFRGLGGGEKTHGFFMGFNGNKHGNNVFLMGFLMVIKSLIIMVIPIHNHHVYSQ